MLRYLEREKRDLEGVRGRARKRERERERERESKVLRKRYR